MKSDKISVDTFAEEGISVPGCTDTHILQQQNSADNFALEDISNPKIVFIFDNYSAGKMSSSVHNETSTTLQFSSQKVVYFHVSECMKE